MHVKSKLRSARSCLLALACIVPGGCASMAGLQDMQFSYHMKGRAAEAWRTSFTSDQRKCLSSDFECGFKQGFYEVAMNRDCRLPPTAPPKYWSAYYQSCEGQKRVEEWFAGYQQGIAVAQSSGQSGSAEIPISPCAPVLNKTGCGACYSGNPCACEPSNCELPTVYPIEHVPTMEASPSDQQHLHVPQPIEVVEPLDVTRNSTSMQGKPKLLTTSYSNAQGLIGGFGSIVD